MNMQVEIDFVNTKVQLADGGGLLRVAVEG